MSPVPNTKPVLTASGEQSERNKGEVPKKSDSKGKSKGSYLTVLWEFSRQGEFLGRWAPSAHSWR